MRLSNLGLLYWAVLLLKLVLLLLVLGCHYLMFVGVVLSGILGLAVS